MPGPSSSKPNKLLDQLPDAIRIKHYSYSTEKTYVHWVKRYILFHIYLGLDTIFARYRNCSGMKVSKRPWFTLMCSIADRRQCEAHWMSDAFGSGLLLPIPGVLSLHRPCQATLELAQIVLPNKTYLMRYYRDHPRRRTSLRSTPNTRPRSALIPS